MPEEIKSVRVHEYGKVQVETVQVDEVPLADNELLVKMISAPVKPLDLSMISGKRTSFTSLPFVAGVEGLGQVARVGKSLDAKLVGRYALVTSFKGVFRSQGVYLRDEVYLLDNEVSLDLVGQNYLINPLTAAGLLAAAKRHDAPALVYTAAASHVGKWLSVFAAKNDVKTIAIVRKEEDIAVCKNHNADVVLNSSDPAFEQQLQDAVDKLQPTAVLDCLAGTFGPHILGKLPADSNLWNYGNLEDAQLRGFSFRDVAKGKRLRRFNVVTDYIKPEEHGYMEEFINKIYKGAKIVRQDMEEFPIERFNEIMENWNKTKLKPVIKF